MIAAAGLVSLDYLADCLRQMAAASNGKAHSDGWGYAFRRDTYWSTRKSVVSCLDDDVLKDSAKGFSELAVFHARKAKTGPDIRFTQPLGMKGYLIFHNTRFSNGEYDPNRLIEYLEERLKHDSFSDALSGLEDVHGANVILVDINRILIGVKHNGSDYFRMHYSADSKGVVVSSEALPGREWNVLPSGSVMELYPDGKMFLNE
ncbi:hypothetical protein KY319_00510 [Candidatus Woesearchaeota archaeon]|nr:hypothetical protein [Candidatus Woesearchaeota archaeon]